MNDSPAYIVQKALGVRRLSRDKLLFINHIVALDLFYPIRMWPKWAIQSMFADKLNNHASWKLAYFFVRNGMPPERAVLWTIYGKVHNGQLVHYRVDKKSRTNLELTFMKNQLNLNYDYFDINHGRLMKWKEESKG